MQRNIERSKSTTQIEKQPQQPLRQSTSQSQRRITGGDNKQDNKTMSQSQSTLTQRDYEKLRSRIQKNRSDKHPLKAIFASMDEQTKRPSHHPWNHRSMKDVIVIEDKAKSNDVSVLKQAAQLNRQSNLVQQSRQTILNEMGTAVRRSRTTSGNESQDADHRVPMMHRQQSAPMTAHSLDMAASSSSRRLMSESRMVQSLDFNNAQESRDNDAQIEQERQKCILRQKQTLRTRLVTFGLKMRMSSASRVSRVSTSKKPDNRNRSDSVRKLENMRISYNKNNENPTMVRLANRRRSSAVGLKAAREQHRSKNAQLVRKEGDVLNLGPFEYAIKRW